jgi:hypothetical protein
MNFFRVVFAIIFPRKPKLGSSWWLTSVSPFVHTSYVVVGSIKNGWVKFKGLNTEPGYGFQAMKLREFLISYKQSNFEG